MNESVKIDGSVYCVDCLQTSFPDQKQLEGRNIVNDPDPTVCQSCGQDFGKEELGLLAGLPVCESCAVTLRNRPFPAWVNAFFLAVMLIVVFSFWWNARFFQAYSEINDAHVAFGSGEVALGAYLMSSAAGRVPENPDITYLSKYMKGVSLLQNDSSAAAYDHFKAIQGFLPNDFGVSTLIEHAELGKSFEEGDYDTFLAKTKAIWQQDTTDAEAWASVASAYACKYVETEDPAFKEESIRYLLEAERLSTDSANVPEYAQRIRHRLHSRQIITGKAFYEKFPNGWTENSE